jgi:hypothetical protein
MPESRESRGLGMLMLVLGLDVLRGGRASMGLSVSVVLLFVEESGMWRSVLRNGGCSTV